MRSEWRPLEVGMRYTDDRDDDALRPYLPICMRSERRRTLPDTAL
jgi:hypothetical protein